MDYEDSDWTIEAAQPATSSAPLWSPVSLLAGVAIGALAASGVWWALAGPPGTSAPATEQSRANAASALAAAAKPAPVESAVMSAPPPIAAPAASGPLAAGDADERKARAWARYYQRPASCEGNPSTEQLVECANHFIRSKRQFDADWAAGRL